MVYTELGNAKFPQKQTKTFPPHHNHGFGFTNKDLEEGCLDCLNPRHTLPVFTVFVASTTGTIVYFSYPCCMFFQMTTFVANGILVTTMLQEFNFFHNVTPFFTRLLATIRHLFDSNNFICFDISGLRKREKESY